MALSLWPRRGLMILVLIVAVAACHRSAPPPSTAKEAPPAEARSLAVAFWNLNWFPGQHPHAKEAARTAHIDVVVPAIGQLDVDVIGLEEIEGRSAAETAIGQRKDFKVDVCSEFLRGPEQKRKRKASAADDEEPGPDESPPTPADYNASWTFPDHQQIALCSRLPVLATGAEPWKPDAAGRRQRRGFVFAVYRSAPGEVLLVYGLHLKSNVVDEPGGRPVNGLLREEASRQFLAHERATSAAWARTDRLRLVIVGGDLNTSLDDPLFEKETTLRSLLGAGGFRWGWEGVPLLRRQTLPPKGRYPAACFDHVLYWPGDESVKLVSATVVNTGSKVSDHRPVVARFSW